MTNTERIQANNAELRECIEIAENLPNAGNVQTENKLANVVGDMADYEITASDLEGVTAIKQYTFYGSQKLKSINIPNSVTSIGESAFQGCTGLTSVTIGNGVTSIGTRVFAGCSRLASVTIGNGVKSIGQSAFERCGIRNLTLPDGLETIGIYAFQNCELTSVHIPESVTDIGIGAFSYTYCSNIKIPSNIIGIRQQVFAGCYYTEYYDFTSHTKVPPLVSTDAFQGIPSTCEIRVPAALVDEWKNATNWNTYADHIVGV